jgi:predicted acetyltransferase
MNIEVRPASIEDKSILRNLMELYNYDFSEFDGADVDAHGLYGYERIDHYWTDEGRHPFLVRVDGRLAGFVLVRTLEEPAPEPVHSIAEFFILRKYRRLGVGKGAACRIFDLFPGRWSVAQIESNLPAQSFWRRIITEYTGGDFEETRMDDGRFQGPVQTFNSRPTPSTNADLSTTLHE